LWSAIATAHQAWFGFTTVPPVAALLSNAGKTSQVYLDYLGGKKKSLVATPGYKKVVDDASASLSYIMETAPVKTCNSIIAPFASPVLKSVSKSQHLKAAVDYWKPMTSSPSAK
jgi:hypothetical protein